MSHDPQRRRRPAIRHALAGALLLWAGAAAAAPADTLAQRVQACVVCHGQEGRATNQGYFPRIAGKPAGYLHEQLLAFRDGRRGNAAMAELTQHLTDAYLREIAEHFAGLDLPHPPPQTLAAPAATLERGKALALRGDAARGLPACIQCHGAAMTGVAPDIPGLLGLPRDYLVSQLGAWQAGLRRARAPDCMAQVATRLTPQDVAAIATWLSAQPVTAPVAPAGALARPLPLPCAGAAP